VASSNRAVIADRLIYTQTIQNKTYTVKQNILLEKLTPTAEKPQILEISFDMAELSPFEVNPSKIPLFIRKVGKE